MLSCFLLWLVCKYYSVPPCVVDFIGILFHVKPQSGSTTTLDIDEEWISACLLKKDFSPAPLFFKNENLNVSCLLTSVCLYCEPLKLLRNRRSMSTYCSNPRSPTANQLFLLGTCCEMKHGHIVHLTKLLHVSAQEDFLSIMPIKKKKKKKRFLYTFLCISVICFVKCTKKSFEEQLREYPGIMYITES